MKQSSREWAKEKKVAGICCFGEKDPVSNPNVIVYDPDGWDRKNFETSIGEKITEKEFNRRVLCSTVMYKRRGND